MDIYYYLIIPIVLVIIVFITKKLIWQRNQRRIVNEKLPEIKEAISEFEVLLNGSDYINRRILRNWLNIYSTNIAKITDKYHHIGLKKDIIRTIEIYFSYVQYFIKYVKKHNDKFAEDCLINNKKLFDSIENYPLDTQQRLAIVHEEDANLVIAGAGCGKTTTLVGKLAYLTKIKKVPKHEILMLAFTRKAANEMKERIKARLGDDFEISTFHSFGYKVVGEVENNKPSLAFDGNESEKNKYIKTLFDMNMGEEKFAKLVVEFFFYEFTTQLKSKKVDAKLCDYLGTEMKSKQEVKIANFLYLHGVNFTYEKDYEHRTSNKEYRQYKPDFYLPDYNIYIEHFGINSDGKASETFDNPRKYEEDIKWKRETHNNHKTKLIETYSYEDSEGGLADKLREKLEAVGVVFKEINYNFTFKNKIKYKDRTLLIEIICTFISLFKSNQYTIDQIKGKANQNVNKILFLTFIELIEPIITEYEKFLIDNKVIDFDDMIAKATNHIADGKYPSFFKYVLIDEFQDISIGRYKLINALNNQHLDMQLFCVGDDWQSIFRFAGSDISIFLYFEKYFGNYHKTIIEKTYRLPLGIANLSNNFILQNNEQIKKTLLSDKQYKDNPIAIFYKSNSDDSSVLDRVLKIIEKESKNKSITILILGRYNWDEPSNLNSLKTTYKKKGTSIEFMTIHRAKGLESDYVIINNVIDDTTGFPSQIADHEVLNLVLQHPESYPFAEERRLLYVALTRTRNKVYIIGQKRKVSPFIFDICNLNNKGNRLPLINSKKCPECFGELVERNGSRGKFIGCSNYDSCSFTFSATTKTQISQYNKLRKQVNKSRDSDLPF